MSLGVAPDSLPLGFPRSISDSLVFFGYFQVPSLGFVVVVDDDDSDDDVLVVVVAVVVVVDDDDIVVVRLLF